MNKGTTNQQEETPQESDEAGRHRQPLPIALADNVPVPVAPPPAVYSPLRVSPRQLLKARGRRSRKRGVHAKFRNLKERMLPGKRQGHYEEEAQDDMSSNQEREERISTPEAPGAVWVDPYSGVDTIYPGGLSGSQVTASVEPGEPSGPPEQRLEENSDQVLIEATLVQEDGPVSSPEQPRQETDIPNLARGHMVRSLVAATKFVPTAPWRYFLGGCLIASVVAGVIAAVVTTSSRSDSGQTTPDESPTLPPTRPPTLPQPLSLPPTLQMIGDYGAVRCAPLS